MNYIAEINAFERWLETNYLPISSQLLWYKLMSLCNRCSWPEWVTVDNLRLMAAMQMSREATFIKVRDELIKAGLIEYQKGKKGSPNKYKIIPFTFKSVVQTEVNTVVESEVKSEVNTVVENAVQTVDINKHKTKTEKKDTNVSKEKNDLTAIFTLYNTICVSYPTIRAMSEKRKKAVRARLRAGYTPDDFRRLFEKAEASEFLKGANGRNWSATFDWLTADANMAKVLDGNYDDKQRRGAKEHDAGRKTGGDETGITQQALREGLGGEFGGF